MGHRRCSTPSSAPTLPSRAPAPLSTPRLTGHQEALADFELIETRADLDALAQDLLGDAPERPVLEARVPATADDDQIRIDLGRERVGRGGRRVARQMRGCIDAACGGALQRFQYAA